MIRITISFGEYLFYCNSVVVFNEQKQISYSNEIKDEKAFFKFLIVIIFYVILCYIIIK